jgi:hypothetical protein
VRRDEIFDEGEEPGHGILLQLPVREGRGGHNLPILTDKKPLKSQFGRKNYVFDNQTLISYRY